MSQPPWAFLIIAGLRHNGARSLSEPRGRRKAVGLALLAAAGWLAGSGASAQALDSRIALADGRRIHLLCSGAGAPTVLLEGGYAATAAVWEGVRERVAPHTRVCAADRAGYGESDPGPTPRDGAAVAADLDEALRAAGVGGPFVLVGHSAGALYVRLFLGRRPADVAGMVLVDPSVEHQDRLLDAAFGPGAGSLAPLRARDERCLEAARAGALPSAQPPLAACGPKVKPGQSIAQRQAALAAVTRPATWETRISEIDTLWGRTSDEIDAGPNSYGDLPLIVLTAGGAEPSASEDQRADVSAVWTAAHRALAARSTRGRQQTVAGASHMMMVDRPEVVAAAVVTVVEEARASLRSRGQ